MTIDQIIDAVLEAEGAKYTNDPADPGGPTRWGITLKTLRRWRQSGGRRGGRQVTAADVRALGRPEAFEIYRVEYVDRPGFDKIPEDVRPFVVDTGVNMGPGTAARMFQTAVGATVDGLIGPKTLARARRQDAAQILFELIRIREDAYVRQVRASVIAYDRKVHAVLDGLSGSTSTVVRVRAELDALGNVATRTKLRFLRGWIARPLGFLP